jgi:hypothetical protein
MFFLLLTRSFKSPPNNDFFQKMRVNQKSLPFSTRAGFFRAGAQKYRHTKSDEKIANFGFSDFVAHQQ